MLALGNLWDATVITTFFIGIVLIVAGVAQIGFAFMAKEAGGLLRGITGAIGILSIVVGIDIAADPKGAVVAVAVAIAFLLVFNGIMRIIAAVMNRQGMWVLGADRGRHRRPARVLDLVRASRSAASRSGCSWGSTC